MKKRILIIILVSCFVFTAYVSLDANSGKDYKVLKNALKDHPVKKGDVTWLRISVWEGKKEKVKIKVPIALLELFTDCVDEKVTIHEGKKVELKEILRILTKNGPQTLIEIAGDDDDEMVKIWVE